LTESVAIEVNGHSDFGFRAVCSIRRQSRLAMVCPTVTVAAKGAHGGVACPSTSASRIGGSRTR
jgi:hypothetical protein